MTTIAAANPLSSPPGGQRLIPHLPLLGKTEGTKQQTDEQEKAKATIDDSLLKVQCGTIHAVGSFRGLELDALVLYQIPTKEPNYIL
jgi:hypothetical protein